VSYVIAAYAVTALSLGFYGLNVWRERSALRREEASRGSDIANHG
jgi:hypothetical protein